VDDLANKDLDGWYEDVFKEDYEEFKAREQECGVYYFDEQDDEPIDSFLRIGDRYFCVSNDYDFRLSVVSFYMVNNGYRAKAYYCWQGRNGLVGKRETGVISLDVLQWFGEISLFQFAERIAYYQKGLKNNV
jgi:hypothetical protein